MPYNPVVAAVFFRAGFIEAWGTGMIKILRECNRAGIPVPSFRSDSLGFGIEFSTGIEIGSEKSSEKGSEKSSEKILELVRNNPLITIRELAERTEISTRAVEKHLFNLQKKSLLKRIGGRKEGRWEVLQ